MGMKVSIYREPWNAELSIMFWSEQAGKIYAAKPVLLEFVPHEEGTNTKPTLTLNHYDAPALLKALAEELDRHGIKTDSDATMAGTLRAQTAHLQDMRTLLKLNKP